MSRGLQNVQVFVFFAIIVFSESAFCGKTVSFYLEPTLGVSNIWVRALEIETSFLSAMTSEINVGDDWTSVDPNAAAAPVGRMVSFRGTGVEVGGSAGFRIAALQLGISFSWSAPEFYGYSKRYTYSPEALSAGGRKFKDKGKVSFVRVLGQVRYGLPLRRFMLDFQTRVGGMMVGSSPIILGRAVESQNAFTGDVGLGLRLLANKWFSVGVLAYVGLYTFAGQYEGAFGTIAGVNGNIGFHF